MTLFSIQLFVLISLSTSLVSGICFQDSDCAFWRPNTNCVWFHCVSPSCRSDEDCKKWGWTSHFCLNNEATFFGKACLKMNLLKKNKMLTNFRRCVLLKGPPVLWRDSQRRSAIETTTAFLANAIGFWASLGWRASVFVNKSFVKLLPVEFFLK